MTYLSLLILLAIALLSLLFFIPARRVFLVHLGQGTAGAVKGDGIDDVVRACAAAAAQSPEVSGEIRVVHRGGELNLHFSRSIPEDLRQRVRSALNP